MPTVMLRLLRQDDVPAIAAWGDDPEFVAAAEWDVRTPPTRRVFCGNETATAPIRLGAVAADVRSSLLLERGEVRRAQF